MNLMWAEDAWNDYCSWQSEDKKTLKKINDLIKDQADVFKKILLSAGSAYII